MVRDSAREPGSVRRPVARLLRAAGRRRSRHRLAALCLRGYGRIPAARPRRVGPLPRADCANGSRRWAPAAAAAAAAASSVFEAEYLASNTHEAVEHLLSPG